MIVFSISSFLAHCRAPVLSQLHQREHRQWRPGEPPIA